MFTNDFLPVKLLAKVLIRKTINVLHFRWSRYSMNRHEDDESTGHSSQSSRHSSRLFKYDDITILIGKNSDNFRFQVVEHITLLRQGFPFLKRYVEISKMKLFFHKGSGSASLKYFSEALTGQLYELKCSPTENILSIKGKLTLEIFFLKLIFQVVWQGWKAFQPISNTLFIRGNYWMIRQS